MEIEIDYLICQLVSAFVLTSEASLALRLTCKGFCDQFPHPRMKLGLILNNFFDDFLSRLPEAIALSHMKKGWIHPERHSGHHDQRGEGQVPQQHWLLLLNRGAYNSNGRVCFGG